MILLVFVLEYVQYLNIVYIHTDAQDRMKRTFLPNEWCFSTVDKPVTLNIKLLLGIKYNLDFNREKYNLLSKYAKINNSC
jgi:hypothetical protein